MTEFYTFLEHLLYDHECVIIPNFGGFVVNAQGFQLNEKDGKIHPKKKCVAFNEKLKTIKAESVDGKKRYVIGHFDDLMDAVQFRNDIKSLGIDDAFVSQYKDGERVMGFDAMKAIDQ